MKLPIPVFYQDKIYTDVDTMEPETSTLTRAYEAMKSGNVFKASLELLAGSIETFYTQEGNQEDSRAEIKKICSHMPYISADTVCLIVLAEMNGDDVIEGLYPCPVCHRNNSPEYDPQYGIDARDHVSDLEIICQESPENEIFVQLKKPVNLINMKTGEIIHAIENMAIRYPTMIDCILAGQNMREGQETAVQIKIYMNALVKVNGQHVDKSFVSVWGKLLFDKIKAGDLRQIGNAMQKYGIEKKIKKQCQHCGKEWFAVVDTSSFFVEGLTQG